jgi:excisionase family DNA binding protein
MYTIEQAGKLIDGISSKLIRKWCQNNEIAHVKSGSKYLLTAKALYEKCGLDYPA